MHDRTGQRRWIRALVLIVYILFALVPLYWMLSIALRTNEETMSTFALLPQHVTFDNFKVIFTDPSWYWGYINSIIYVVMNTVFSVLVALPAAYAFSRYRFLGDKHMFFWLLTNRMTPPAVFLLPFFQLYSSIGLQDTYFVKIFLPLIKSGVGVTAFFCFMFSWVELLLARTLTTVNAKPIAAVMTRTVSAAGMDWGVLSAAGVLTIVPGALVIYFVRNYIAKGFAMGRV
jgi:glycerol transport system permease protein